MDASYTEPISDAVPISYAILSVPPKSEMRKKGYDPTHLAMNGSEAHPLARWSSYSLPAGCGYKEALTALQEANGKPWGLIRARLHFSDGTEEMFERSNPRLPNSFRNIRTYDPNGVYRVETMQRSEVNRATRKPQLIAIADERGHHRGSKPLPVRTFAPEVLYRECPPPVHSQAGFDFTPVGYNSYLLRSQDPPVGVRDVKSNFMHSSADYRPRSYLRCTSPDSRHCHCAEVYQVGDYTQDLAQYGTVIENRNRRTVKKTTSIGTLKPNSTIIGRRHVQEPRFPCTTTVDAAAPNGATVA